MYEYIGFEYVRVVMFDDWFCCGVVGMLVWFVVYGEFVWCVMDCSVGVFGWFALFLRGV